MKKVVIHFLALQIFLIFGFWALYDPVNRLLVSHGYPDGCVFQIILAATKLFGIIIAFALIGAFIIISFLKSIK